MMLQSVRPICTVEKKRLGCSARRNAAAAPLLPSSAICFSRAFRAETMAISPRANRPWTRISNSTIRSSMAIDECYARPARHASRGMVTERPNRSLHTKIFACQLQGPFYRGPAEHPDKADDGHAGDEADRREQPIAFDDGQGHDGDRDRQRYVEQNRYHKEQGEGDTGHPDQPFADGAGHDGKARLQQPL